MKPRERLAPNAYIIRTFEPVSESVLANLVLGLTEHLQSDAGAETRRISRGGDGRWGRLSRREAATSTAGTVTRVPAGLSRQELIRVAYRRGFRALPITFTISGHRLAVMQPQTLYDDESSWTVLHDILQRAAGEDPARVQPHELRRPLVHAFRTAGLQHRRVLAPLRQERLRILGDTEPAQQTRPSWSRDQALTSALSTAFEIGGSTIHPAGLDDVTSPAEGGGTPSTAIILAAAVLTSLRSSVIDDSDFRVRFDVDLRTYLAPSTVVHACFTHSEPVGTLRTADWSPAAIARRLADDVASGAALVSFSSEVVRAAKRPLFSSFRRRSSRAEIRLSILTRPLVLPEGFWAPGVPSVAGARIHRDGPAALFVQVAPLQDGHQVFLWDETGLFDHERFGTIFRTCLVGSTSRSTLTGSL